jgi:Xaa-Pro aminopeptidase
MVGQDLEHALFSRAEMARRYAAAGELMARRGIDALLISGEENFQYFAGTAASLTGHYSLTRPSLFILPVDAEPAIVTQGRNNLTLGCYVRDIRDYHEVLRFPHEAVVDALTDKGLGAARIGVELGLEQRMGLPVAGYLDLVDAMPEAKFSDAADLIIELRMVKSPEEVAYIKEAAEITGRARQRLFDMVVSGMTERDVARLMRRLVLEEGGDRTSFVILQLDAPGARNQLQYERPLEKGSVLSLDAGAYYRMYTVDYARMATLGRATDEQKRVYRAVLDVNQRMMDALRPGVTCSELHRLTVEAVADAGMDPDSLEKLRGSRFGHGQGMLVTEPPSINPGDDTALQPGMVISTEPGVRSGDVQFQWEDVHVITKDGYEQLTLETDEFRELPF